MRRTSVTKDGLVGAAIALAKVLSLVASVIFASAFTTNLLTSDVGDLDALDLSIGHVEVLRLEATIAIIASDDVQAGRADPAVADASRERVDRTRRELASSLAAVDAIQPVAVMGSVADFLAALESERTIDAAEIFELRVSPALEQLGEELVSARNDALAQMQSVSSITGSAASAAGAVMVFFGPLGLIIAYRAVARLQLTAAEKRARDEAHQDLEQSKDRFIAGLSHELRTPLTAVIGFSKILEELEGSDTETGEIGREISYQASELARMVEDLLVAARLDVELAGFDLEEHNPGRLVSDALAMIPQEPAVSVSLGDGPVTGDGLRIRHVIRNLVANARTHGVPPILIEGRTVDGRYVMTVSDRGRGIDAAPSEVFERFLHKDLQPLTSGSVGLGLYVARALVEGMDGTLTYERAGGWTRFVVDLPSTAARTVAPEVAHA